MSDRDGWWHCPVCYRSSYEPDDECPSCGAPVPPVARAGTERPAPSR